MKKLVFESEIMKSIDERNAILLELRNALTAVLLILSDLQFERELERGRAIEQLVTQTLQRITVLQDTLSL